MCHVVVADTDVSVTERGMQMTPIAELKAEILSQGDETLREIIDFAITEHKRRLAAQSREKAFALRSTPKVRFIGEQSSRLPFGAEGVLLRINAKSASANFGQYGHWRISCALLEPAGEVNPSAGLPAMSPVVPLQQVHDSHTL